MKIDFALFFIIALVVFTIIFAMAIKFKKRLRKIKVISSILNSSIVKYLFFILSIGFLGGDSTIDHEINVKTNYTLKDLRNKKLRKQAIIIVVALISAMLVVLIVQCYLFPGFYSPWIKK
jgi:hypothetical protein